VTRNSHHSNGNAANATKASGAAKVMTLCQ
jgi:hypothetical protein